MFVAAIARPPAARAGIGFGDSAPGPLDALEPRVAIALPLAGSAFRGGETALLRWSVDEANLSAADSARTARLLVDGAPLDSLVYAGTGQTDWPWPVPELHSSDCYLRVTAGDAFGNLVTVTGERFTLLLSSTDVPDLGFAGPALLHAPAPNPFNPAVRVAFALAEPGRARVTIHDPRGRLVRVLADGPLPAGEHALVWEGEDALGRRVAAGAYLIRLSWRGASGAVERTAKAVMVP